MAHKKESLGSFWDEWEKETEALEKATCEKVEQIKNKALERQSLLEFKEDIKNEMP